jgi:hypothetical protein
VRPLGIFSGGALLAALNPFLLAGSAADSVVTTAVNLWHYNRLSSPEREALARYSALLERDPHTRDAPEIARAIRRLGEKRAEALCDATVRLAEKAIDEDDVDHAVYYAHAADRVDGCAERGRRPIEKATALRTERDAREESGALAGRRPATGRSATSCADYHDLLVATALADPGAIIGAASRFRARHATAPSTPPPSTRSPSPATSRASRRGARALVTVAARTTRARAARPRAVLASPDYDGSTRSARPSASTRATPRATSSSAAARRTHRALHGEPLRRRGLRAAQSFGIFNVIGVATRAWQAWRKDPVSNQAIIDRGEDVPRARPALPRSTGVHARLADAYERAGLYDARPAALPATADPSPKRIAKLEDKLADRLYDDAERSGGDPILWPASSAISPRPAPPTRRGSVSRTGRRAATSRSSATCSRRTRRSSLRSSSTRGSSTATATTVSSPTAASCCRRDRSA